MSNEWNNIFEKAALFENMDENYWKGVDEVFSFVVTFSYQSKEHKNKETMTKMHTSFSSTVTDVAGVIK